MGSSDLDDLKHRTVRGGAAKLCGQITNFAIRIGYMAIMARLLDPSDFGLVAMVTAITGILDLLTSAGLSSATIQKDAITNAQLSTLFWINMLIGTILALLCLAGAPVLVRLYDEPRLFWMTVAMSAAFLFNAAGVQHVALVHRQLRHVAFAGVETLSQLVSVVTGIAMAIAGFGHWSLVAATIVGPAVMTASVWTLTAWIPEMPRRNTELRSLLGFGGTTTLWGLTVYVTYNLDKFLVGRVWGAVALGVYGRAYQLINIPTTSLSAAVGWVAFSALSRLQNDHERLRSYFLKGYALVISMTVPSTVFCAFFANDVVRVVLGQKWEAAAAILRLLTPAVVVLGLTNPAIWLLHSIGLQGRALRVSLVNAPLVIVAYIVGLSYGPTGVALAFSVTMTLWLVPHVLWSLHNTVVSPLDLFLAMWRPCLASIVAGISAFWVVFYQFQSQPPILRLLVGAGVMGSMYLGVLLFVMGQKTLYVDMVRRLKPL
jgi:PST family polysaccharide transporter